MLNGLFSSDLSLLRGTSALAKWPENKRDTSAWPVIARGRSRHILNRLRTTPNQRTTMAARVIATSAWPARNANETLPLTVYELSWPLVLRPSKSRVDI